MYFNHPQWNKLHSVFFSVLVDQEVSEMLHETVLTGYPVHEIARNVGIQCD